MTDLPSCKRLTTPSYIVRTSNSSRKDMRGWYVGPQSFNDANSPVSQAVQRFSQEPLPPALRFHLPQRRSPHPLPLLHLLFNRQIHPIILHLPLQRRIQRKCRTRPCMRQTMRKHVHWFVICQSSELDQHRPFRRVDQQARITLCVWRRERGVVLCAQGCWFDAGYFGSDGPCEADG